MLNINHHKKLYHIKKKSIVFILEKLSGEKLSVSVEEKELRRLMRKYHLYDEYFLEHVNEM